MKTRIGLIIVPSDDLNDVVLQFLVLHLNTLQASFQFEFYPFNHDLSLLATLAGDQVVAWDDVRGHAKSFGADYRDFLNKEIVGYSTQEVAPRHFVIVSMARFTDNYFSHREENAQVLALGNWQRHMAPPSIHEFLITLILRQAVSAVSPSLRGSVHYGTKGCLCDVGTNLSDVRFKVLNGFICDYCRKRLKKDRLPNLADELTPILSFAWLGKLDDPASPAGIAANLGFKLYVTRGVKPRWNERFLDFIQQEGIKQVLRVVGAVVVAALLLWLGLGKK